MSGRFLQHITYITYITYITLASLPHVAHFSGISWNIDLQRADPMFFLFGHPSLFMTRLLRNGKGRLTKVWMVQRLEGPCRFVLKKWRNPKNDQTWWFIMVSILLPQQNIWYDKTPTFLDKPMSFSYQSSSKYLRCSVKARILAVLVADQLHKQGCIQYVSVPAAHSLLIVFLVPGHQTLCPTASEETKKWPQRSSSISTISNIIKLMLLKPWSNV